jgi:DNA repair photolyase
MGLNLSTGNMYEFITHTWNTIKGECFHDCSYCYMKRWGKLKPVRFDEKELKSDLGTGNFIFVGSSCDMWSDVIPPQWQNKTLDICDRYSDNRYLFQTKNPNNLIGFDLPKNSIICTTIESDMFYPDIMVNSPEPMQRSIAMQELSEKYETFITIEPILDFNLDHFVRMIRRCNPKQVNIGADSGRNNLPEPTKGKVLQLVAEIEKFTIIHNKSNLQRLL